MKVRIIKTSAGYVPQVSTSEMGERPQWQSTEGTHLWISVDLTYKYATYRTLWGAKLVLKNWLRKNIKGTKKLEAFKKELENPNVVYEAEV